MVWLVYLLKRQRKQKATKRKSKSFTPRLANWRLKTIFVSRAEAMSPAERKTMIRKDRADLSLSRQCRRLKISRSSMYYKSVGVDAETLRLMNEIDRVFTKYPFCGSRQISACLERRVPNLAHKGRYLDNIFIERLWRPLKQETV